MRRWLFAQLGPGTDTADLDARYARLGSGRAVALEVLREKGLVEPLGRNRILIPDVARLRALRPS